MPAGMSLSETHLLLSSNSVSELYDLTTDPPKLLLDFSFHQGPSPILQGRLLFRPEGATVQVCTMAGAVQQTLTVPEVRP